MSEDVVQHTISIGGLTVLKGTPIELLAGQIRDLMAENNDLKDATARANAAKKLSQEDVDRVMLRAGIWASHEWSSACMMGEQGEVSAMYRGLAEEARARLQAVLQELAA